MPSTPRKSIDQPAVQVRESWATLDALVQRAFAPPAASFNSPTLTPPHSRTNLRLGVPVPRPTKESLAGDHAQSLAQSQADERAMSMFFEPPTPEGEGLDPVWKEVRLMKARMLAALPSKVKSLEKGVFAEGDVGEMGERVRVQDGEEGEEEHPGTPTCKCRNGGRKGMGSKEGLMRSKSERTERTEQTQTVKVDKPLPDPPNPHKLKRKVSAIFKEGSDGTTISATFDLTGVRKQDMHVAFKTNRVVVTWRRIKTVEKMENGTLVRERREKQYSQTIPLPEGVEWKEIKASREANGNKLVLTFPALRCVRAESHSPSTTLWSSGATDFQTALTTVRGYEDVDIEKE